MNCVMIMYPVGEGSTFDMDYYTSSHMPMFAERLGDVCSGWGVMTDHSGAYHAVAWAVVEDMAAFNEKMAEHGGEIIGDVANYTNTQPTMITGDIVATDYAE